MKLISIDFSKSSYDRLKYLSDKYMVGSCFSDRKKLNHLKTWILLSDDDEYIETIADLVRRDRKRSKHDNILPGEGKKTYISWSDNLDYLKFIYNINLSNQFLIDYSTEVGYLGENSSDYESVYVLELPLEVYEEFIIDRDTLIYDHGFEGNPECIIRYNLDKLNNFNQNTFSKNNVPKNSVTNKDIYFSIDSILEKISKGGISSLTKEEKDFLDNKSKDI